MTSRRVLKAKQNWAKETSWQMSINDFCGSLRVTDCQFTKTCGGTVSGNMPATIILFWMVCKEEIHHNIHAGHILVWWKAVICGEYRTKRVCSYIRLRLRNYLARHPIWLTPAQLEVKIISFMLRLLDMFQTDPTRTSAVMKSQPRRVSPPQGSKCIGKATWPLLA